LTTKTAKIYHHSATSYSVKEFSSRAPPLDGLRLASVHRQFKPATTLGLYQVKDPQRCGIAIFDENKVALEFIEKPAQPKSNWAFSGVLLGTPRLQAIPRELPADLGFHVLPKLVNRMLAYPISDYLVDISTM